METYKRKLNREIIQQILDSFVELTGIRAAYFENTSETITGKNKPLCEFCKLLREYKEFDTCCKISDTDAVKIAEYTRKPYIYKCHIGLYEAVIPIYIKNTHIGVLMLGQVMCIEEYETHLSSLKQKLHFLNIELEKIERFASAYENISTMSMAKIEAAANMLDIIAQHIINTDVIYVYDMDSIEKAKHYISQHFTESLSIRAISRFSGLSPSYLSFLFKRETGITITHYIDRYRLNYAKDLLKITSQSVKEISALIGYSDQNYFSRIFKKHEGISPIEYRTKNKKSC